MDLEKTRIMTSALDADAANEAVHCLELIDGAHIGRRYWISALGAIVGRTPPADIVIADSEVSRQHCRITVQGGELLIADLNSTNGTFIDGERLEEPMLFPIGAVLKVGRQSLRLLDPNAPITEQRIPEAPDIFLSYNREDQATARRFAEAFQAEGFDVWWDVTLRAGEAYDEVTENALRTARAVVVLWSKRSVVSRWVRAEATLGDRNGTLLPAMIEPCERPVMFELTQTADLSKWSGATDDKAWRAFLADVHKMVGPGKGAQDKTAVKDSDAE